MKKVLLLIIIILLVEAGVYVWLTQRPPEMVPSPQQSMSREGVVTTVKQEAILDSDVAALKQVAGAQKEEVLLNQLQRESIILQAAAAEGLIALPPEFSKNTPSEKTFSRENRLGLLKQAEEAYNKRGMKISGGQVIVFFYNYGLPSIPLNEAQALALKLITEQRNRVVNKTQTVAGAIAALSQNPQMQQIDWNYKNNTGRVYEKEYNVWEITRDPIELRVITSLPQTDGTQVVSEIARYPGTEAEFPLSKFDTSGSAKTGFIEGSYETDDNGYYFFYVVTKKTSGYTESFSAWTDKKVVAYTQSNTVTQ